MRHVFPSSILVFALPVCVLAFNLSQQIVEPFDRIGDGNCESEMARLDNLAIQIQNEPGSRGVLIFYAGKMAGDKLPRRGEAEARVERMRSYLIKRRGIPSASLVVMDGGFSSNFHVQLWVVSPTTGLPTPERYSGVKEIQYRRGKLNPRDYRCGI
jgi:hypothetical protein